MYFFEFSLLILFLFIFLFMLIVVVDFFKMLILMEVCFLFLSLLFLIASIVLDDFYGQFFILVILTMAAMESALGMALLIFLYHVTGTLFLINLNRTNKAKFSRTKEYLIEVNE